MATVEKNVLRLREELSAERKKEYDAPLLEYRARMGDAPERVRAALLKLQKDEPQIRSLCNYVLKEYPPPASWEALSVKNAVSRLRQECLGALSYLGNNIPSLAVLLNQIGEGAAEHIAGFQIDAIVTQDLARVNAAVNILDYSSFAERIAELEKILAEKVTDAAQKQRAGAGAPVERGGGVSEEERMIPGTGDVITNLKSGE